MLSPGRMVDRYTVLHPVGRGGAATVYAVRHQVLGTLHALKVPHDKLGADAWPLVQEGRLQARLDTQHILPVTDVLEVDGKPALLMPLVSGCSLRDLTLLNGWVVQDLVGLALGILSGLAAAHREGFVHGDLKPSNVLLHLQHGDVQVRVSDFGVAPLLQGSSPRRFAGTPAYAAPEQLAGAPVGPQADLWGLGLILLELGAGWAHPGAEPLKLRAAAVAEFADTGLPEVLRHIVARLLRADPAHRPTSATETANRILDTVPGASAALFSEGLRVAVEASARPVHASSFVERPWRAAQGAEPTVSAFEPPASPPQAPTPAGAFVGRRTQLEQLRTSLSAGKQVTLLGPGGIGKTRIALEYASQDPESWPGGVGFCDLAEVHDAAGVARQVSRALGMAGLAGDPVRAIGQVLATRARVLLILDNAEACAEPLRQAIRQWSSLAPDAYLLVTSRQLLGLPDERVVDVPTLPPDEAVTLFRRRAAAIGGQLDDQEEALHQLVARLDGLPLALELAAARSRVLSVSTMLQHIEDRFRLLVSRHATTSRHAALASTIAWSWNLLTAHEQHALRQLAVFDGAFDLTAMEAVVALDADAPWEVDVLHSLVDKSMVRVAQPGWFDLLQSIAAFAREQTAEDASVHERFVAYFSSFGTEAALEALDGIDGQRRFGDLQRQFPNVKKACTLALASGQPERAGQAALAAWVVSMFAGPPDEGAALLDAAYDHPGLSASLRTQLQEHRAFAAFLLGDATTANTRYETALAQAETLPAGLVRAGVMLNVAQHHQRRGDLDAALRLGEAALAMVEDLGSRRMQGHVLAMLGRVRGQLGRTAEAETNLRTALTLLEEVGSGQGVRGAWSDLGTLYANDGRREDAQEAYERSLSACRANHDERGVGGVLGHLAGLKIKAGRLDEASGLLHEALEVNRRIGHLDAVAVGLFRLGRVAFNQLEPLASRVHFQQALDLSRRLHRRPIEAAALRSLAELALATRQLSDAASLLDEALSCERDLRSARGEAAVRLLRMRLARLRELDADVLDEWATLEALFDEGDASETRAFGWVESGRAHAAQGNLQAALKLYDRALTAFDAAGLPVGQCITQVERTAVLLQSGTLTEAEAAANHALSSLTPAVPPDARLRLWQVLAHHYQRSGDERLEVQARRRVEEIEALLG